MRLVGSRRSARPSSLGSPNGTRQRGKSCTRGSCSLCQQGNYRSRARHTFRHWGMHKVAELRAEKVEGVVVVVTEAGVAEEGSSSCMSHRSCCHNYDHIHPNPKTHNHDHTPSCSRYLR